MSSRHSFQYDSDSIWFGCAQTSINSIISNTVHFRCRFQCFTKLAISRCAFQSQNYAVCCLRCCCCCSYRGALFMHFSPKLLTGYLRGGDNLDVFARRLDLSLKRYPNKEYESNGCLGDSFKDTCVACMCLEGGEGNPVVPKHYGLSASSLQRRHRSRGFRYAGFASSMCTLSVESSVP